MPLTFQNEEMLELMKDFYTLTGIRIVLFDETYREIFSYPEECIPFCTHMRKNAEFYHLCCRSDRQAFEICKKNRSFNMYKCHAGLIECTAPIIEQNAIIGYIMFGQVSDSKNFCEILSKQYPDAEIEPAIKKIKYKNAKQLLAASKILEACTSYILAKEMLKPSRIHLFNRIDTFISAHLEDDISITAICKEFNISRTRLYDLVKQYIGTGVSEYIKEKRLLKARELLKTTDLSVVEISHKVGFSDYNYFLRSFKKKNGISAKRYRNFKLHAESRRLPSSDD